MNKLAGALAGALAVIVLAGCQVGQAGSAGPTFTPGPRLVARIHVGDRPVAPAAGAGAVWVPNSADGTVSRVDPRRNRVVATITVGIPQAMLAHGCGPTSEHNFYSGSFLFRRCDLPSAVAVSPVAVWATKNDDRSVARIDPASNRIVKVIPTASDLWGIAADQTQVWVTDYYNGAAVRIDPATNSRVATVSGLKGPTGVVIAYGSAWVVDSSARQLVRIDSATNQVVASVPVGDNAAGIVAGFGSVWVQNEVAATLTRVDADTNRVIATVQLDGREGRNGLAGLTVFQGRIWTGGIQIEGVDPATNRVDQRLPQDGIAVTAGFGSIWAASILGDLVRIDIPARR